MVELWKDIAGYENLYQVSNLGNVRSFWGKTPKILKATKNNEGYWRIGLNHYNKPPKKFLVHRLVAEAFIPNPKNLPLVNHKDENPSNNNVNNLEWCTREYNLNYSTAKERRVKKLTNRKDLSKPVLQYDKNGNFIEEYPSLMDAERKTGVFHSNIGKVCKGKYRTYGGYVWKYKQS